MSFGFDTKDNFYIDVKPLVRSVGSPRQEFAERAKSILQNHKNLILAFSGGIDSQATYLAFQDIGYKIECAFMHLPKYNDNEYENVLHCVKKWNINLTTITLDPYKLKDKILSESNRLQIPPNQILHSIFLEHLPEEKTFVEGFNGPDPYVHEGKHYILESANSVEYARIRAYKQRNKRHTAVFFEKDEHLLASIIKDGTLTSMCNAWNYYKIPGLSYDGEDPISIINYWDLFIKPTFYGKNWGNDLHYVYKYQGCEKIDFIINGMEHDYTKNNMFLDINKLMDHLENGKETKRYWQRNLNQ